VVTAAERRTAGTTWPPSRTIVLCATPRTGSTLACDVLAGTEQLGYPKEPFAAVAVPACADAWAVPLLDDDPERYLRAALTNGTTPNGICAVKVMWEDVARLARAADRHTADVLDCFVDPVALLVTRRDKLAAAVSQHRAERTGEWSSGGAGTRPHPGAPDLDRVSELHRAQHDGADRWRELVLGAAVPSAEVVYEEVADDPARIATVAARLVGVELDGEPTVRTGLQVQRDDWNRDVRRRWDATTGGCDRGCPVA
jgi:LPS sulfotransferase NodH